MKKRIYLSIIYFITLMCIIIGVLGNVFNISPFTRMTMASSGKYIENSSIYDNVSDISIDMNLGSVEIKKGSKLEVIYTGAEKFKPAVSVSGTSLNIEQHVKVQMCIRDSNNIHHIKCSLYTSGNLKDFHNCRKHACYHKHFPYISCFITCNQH